MNWTQSVTTPGGVLSVVRGVGGGRGDHHRQGSSSVPGCMTEGPGAAGETGGGGSRYYPTSQQVTLQSSTIMMEGDDEFGGGLVSCGSPAAILLSNDILEDNSGSGLNNDEENQSDLFVFGYGCKIFRDDDRAKWVDQQKHLIPWMGNSDLLIDRYDGRGALMDVSRFEAGASTTVIGNELQDYDNTFEIDDVTEEALDEERYRDFNEDDDYDDGAYDRATDFKRLQSAMEGIVSNSDTRQYASLGYDYNEQNHEICMGPEPKPLHDEDALYVQPVGLYIPNEIVAPTTMKVHAIIEKTAKFISSQGSQMEILLKTKQASNPLFDFLNHGGALNPYYKFLVSAIRDGSYRPSRQESDNDPPSPSSTVSTNSLTGDGGGEEAHGYLHPSLFRTTSSTTLPFSSTLSSSGTSSKHNAYSMLVSKIKGADSPDPITQQQHHHIPKPTNEYDNANSTTSTAFGKQTAAVQQQQSTNSATRPKNQLPSTQDQLIIEKMASYVVKNGTNFESLAKNKSDPRFGFLQPSHKYHWYYLNCKERFKAECNAVVASKEFVTYGTGGGGTSTTTNTPNASTNSSLASLPPSQIKKSVALLLQEKKKEKSTGIAVPASITITSAEDVFSQINLVTNKEKDKPMIRFSSALGLTTSKKSETNSTATGGVLKNADKSKVLIENRNELRESEEDKVNDEEKVETISDNEKEEGEIDDDPALDISLLDDEIRGGNPSPVSEDEDVKRQRRLERKRKAALFLQNLKMAKKSDDVGQKTENQNKALNPEPKRSNPPKQVSSTSNKIKATVSSSLGDLLSRRMQVGENNPSRSRSSAPLSSGDTSFHGVVELSDDDDLNEGEKSSSSLSSRQSNRRKNKTSTSYRTSQPSSKPRKRRRRSRSYSSTPSYSSSASNSSTDYGSKKKSSKRKHKKKKKKHEKSRSSHKSSRR